MLKSMKPTGRKPQKFKQWRKRRTDHRRTHHDHFADTFGIFDRNRKADRTAHAMTHQRRIHNAQLIHELIYKADEILNSIRFTFPA